MVGGITMSIDEKAKDFAAYNAPFIDDSPIIPVFARMMMAEKQDGFKAGAEWMLEKALDWIGDNVVSNKFGEPINTEDFIKAMEE